MTQRGGQFIHGSTEYLPTAAALALRIDQEPIFVRENDDYWVRCYGSVYNPDVLEACDFSGMTDERLATVAMDLAGWFCLVHHDRQTGITTLANDIFGNFRLYSYDDGHVLTVSDNWRELTERIRSDRGVLEFSEHERYYFRRHRYTTGGRTFVRGLDKVLPASLYRATDAGVEQRTYFPIAVGKTVDDAEYKFRNYNLLMNNLLQAIEPDLPNVLMFSGGVDSTFLACCLMDNGTHFRPLFIEYDPPDRDNLVDGHKAATVAEHLGLNLDVITVPISQHRQLIDRVVQRTPFDKALAVPLEYTFGRLAKLCGPCNIINGASSDSIYCWGASGKTIGCLIQRFLASDHYTNRSVVIRALISAAVGAIYRHRWSMPIALEVPHRDEAYWLGLLDPQGYVPINHTSSDMRAYHEYLLEIVEPLANSLGRDHDAIRMYMKMMFLQGPTNVQLIEGARAYGHRMVLPFVDGRIVQLRRGFQDDWRNVRYPRYVLEETLRQRFGFDPEVIDSCRAADISDCDGDAFAALEKEIYDQWDRVSARLF